MIEALTAPESQEDIGNVEKERVEIKRLLLGGNRIQEKGARTIARYIQLNKELIQLNLRFNNLEDAGARYLARVISSHASLQEIDLSCNMVSRAGSQALFRAFASNQCLHRVLYVGNDLRGSEEELVQFFQRSKHLQEVDLWCCKIGVRGAILLANALTNTDSTLHTLNIGNNDISDRGATAIANALHINVNLTKVDISSNRITDEGGMALAEALQKNRHLVHLNLAENSLSLQSCLALIRRIRDHPTMRYLSLLRNTNITDKDCQAVLDMFAAYNRLDNYSRASILMSSEKGVEEDDGEQKWIVNSPLKFLMARQLDHFSPILPPSTMSQRMQTPSKRSLFLESSQTQPIRSEMNQELSVSPILPERAINIKIDESLKENVADAEGESISSKLLAFIDKTLTEQNQRLDSSFSSTTKRIPGVLTATVSSVLINGDDSSIKEESILDQNVNMDMSRNGDDRTAGTISHSPILGRMRYISLQQRRNKASEVVLENQTSIPSMSEIRKAALAIAVHENKTPKIQVLDEKPQNFVQLLKHRGLIGPEHERSNDVKTLEESNEGTDEKIESNIQVNGEVRETPLVAFATVDSQSTPLIPSSIVAQESEEHTTIGQLTDALPSGSLSPNVLAAIRRKSGEVVNDHSCSQEDDSELSAHGDIADKNEKSFDDKDPKGENNSESNATKTFTDSQGSRRGSINAAVLNPKVRKSLGLHRSHVSTAPSEQIAAMNDPLAKRNLSKRRYSFLASADRMNPTLPSTGSKSRSSKIIVDLDQSNATIFIKKRRLIGSPRALYSVNISETDARVLVNASDPHAFSLVLRARPNDDDENHGDDDGSQFEDRELVFRVKSIAARDEIVSTLNAFIYKNRSQQEISLHRQSITGLDLDGDDSSLHTIVTEIPLRIVSTKSNSIVSDGSDDFDGSDNENASTGPKKSVRALVTRLNSSHPGVSLPMEKGEEFEVVPTTTAVSTSTLSSSRGWLHVRSKRTRQIGYIRRCDVEDT